MAAMARERIAREGWRNVTVVQSGAEDAQIAVTADAALFCAVHDILQSPDALRNVMDHLRPRAPVAAGGGKWASPWMMAVNLQTRMLHAPYVRSFEGFDRPWNHLEQLIDDVHVRELAFGSGYVLTGRSRRSRRSGSLVVTGRGRIAGQPRLGAQHACQVVSEARVTPGAAARPAGPRPVTGSRLRRSAFCRREDRDEAQCGKGLVMAGSGDSVTGLPELGGRGPVVLDGMRVLRLCSVFEPAALSGRSAGYDAIGGMHNHTAELSRQLDRMGARQLVLTSRLDGPAGRTEFGRRGQVVRTGVDTRLARQAWALLAAPLALGGPPVDVVHGHCGEDIAVLPLARLAARRHRCPLVITVHASVRHNMQVTSARTAWLRLAGGLAERRALAAADMVIALTPAAADRLAGEGIPGSRIRVIPPGYDPDLFAAGCARPVPGPRAAAGRLHRPDRPAEGRRHADQRVRPPHRAGLPAHRGRRSRPACRRSSRRGRWPGRSGSPASPRTRGSPRCCGTSTCWSWPPGTRSCPRC